MTAYYAVHHGRETGVFDTWEECINQVKGYPGAIYKKFKTRKVADIFVKFGYRYTEHADESDLIVVHQIPKSQIWYSVHYGREPGVYKTVEEYRKQVDGWKGEVSKQFKLIEHAELFVKFGYRYVDHIKQPPIDIVKKNVINVYTDGSFRPQTGSLDSQRVQAYCGYGIYIPQGDIKISQKLYCGKLTNNVAELSAFLALYIIINKSGDLRYNIYTDSTYCIQVLTSFGEKHEKKGWLTGSIPNFELVRACYTSYKPLIASGTVELTHIRGHGGTLNEHTCGNEIADHLANGIIK